MLTCKVCGFQHPTNLIEHIEAEHSNLANRKAGLDALQGYIAKYNCETEDIVVTSDETKTKGTAVKKEKGAVKLEEAEEEFVFEGVSIEEGSGGEYVPERNIAYFFPKVTKDVMQDINEKKKVILTGHCGTGKSSLIEQIAARTSQGLMRANLNAQITIGDFVGLWTVKSGETVWVDGILPKAMREGLWLVLEEIDFAEPAILSALNTVLENNGKLVLKEKGHEIVRPHENFRIFATANTVGAMQGFRSLYQGTNIMNEAFLDRFRCYLINYLPADEEAKVVSTTVPKMTERVAAVIVRVAGMVREAFVREEISCTFSTRRVLDWSELMIRHKDPFKAAEVAVFSKISREDAEVIRGIIQRLMVSKP